MKTRSLSGKIVLISSVIILVCALVVGSAAIVLFRNESITMHSQEAMSIADSVASILDGDQFLEILETGEKTEYYQLVKGFVDQVITRTDLAYLYVLSADYGEECTYFVEGYELGSDEEMFDLGDREPAVVYADELFETLSTGQPTTTRIYDSQGFGNMVSAFVPVVASDGTVVGVVGIDLYANRVAAMTLRFIAQIVPVALLVCVVVSLLVRRFIQSALGRPIAELTAASDKLARGDMDVRIETDSNDEIGALAASFRSMVEGNQRQIDVLDAMAKGDLTKEIRLRGENDSMGAAIRQTQQNLNKLFAEILEAVDSVSNGSQQIAQGAQYLADGASQQASTVQELSQAMEDIDRKTVDNARQAEEATGVSRSIQETAQAGSKQMERMTQAVQEIDTASQSISKVIKAIEDIAFQTNILALNASVEAARAGQHGKGFAVVANEVRSLAAKSARAAQETSALISNTMEKAQLGAVISRDAAAYMDEISSGIAQSYRLMSEISRSAEEQSIAISQVNQGISQVSEVIHQNTALSEQSAASSSEMRAMADALRRLVCRFKIAGSPDTTGITLEYRRVG